MSSVFLDADGFGHFEAMPRTTTNKADAYCSTQRLATAGGKSVDICREMLPFSTTLHPTLRMSDTEVLQSFHWELLDHRLCGFDLVLPDCDLFGPLKQHDNEEV